MTVHAEVFNSTRDHLRTQKASKLLAAGDPTDRGAYTAPQLQALPKPHPALNTSGWGEATEGPQVTLEPWPLRALLRHCRAGLIIGFPFYIAALGCRPSVKLVVWHPYKCK